MSLDSNTSKLAGSANTTDTSVTGGAACRRRTHASTVPAVHASSDPSSTRKASSTNASLSRAAKYRIFRYSRSARVSSRSFSRS